MPWERDENLRQFATDRQWEILEAWWAEGSAVKAGEKLGIDQAAVGRTKFAVLRKAALRGYAPGYDTKHIVPDGFKLKGTSTLYDDAGNQRLQWVKTSRDQERQAEFLKEAAEAFASELPRIEPTTAQPGAEHLLAAYPVGDHHFGMYAWREEAGADYDLGIAERLLFGGFDYLISAAPQANTALIAFLGDFMHYDSMIPVTPTSNNQLDADSRFGKMVRTAIRGMRYAIRSALQKHNKVQVIVEIGNHDLASSVFLMEALANIYENEPRVSVDTSPSHFHYYKFGQNLIGTHHGHGVKLDRLPIIMAADKPEEWGQTRHRYWSTGHVHEKRVFDQGGASVESFRVLPPTDAWAHQKGYRSTRNMTGIVLHKEHGEVARHTVTPEMMDG
jgi:hypothetical protein